MKWQQKQFYGRRSPQHDELYYRVTTLGSLRNINVQKLGQEFREGRN